MSLRSAILTHALPLIPTHSFTRSALSAALTRLPADHPAAAAAARPGQGQGMDGAPLSDAALDTLYGEGNSAALALVQRWAEEGAREMLASGSSAAAEVGDRKGKGKGKDERLESVLEKRLEYSARVGEHIVEAYAVLSSPTSARSLPLPSLPVSLSALLALRLPAAYLPPGARALAASASAADILRSYLSRTGGRVPLISANPAGPLAYAWAIADAAILAEERAEGVRRGVMGEPVGAGPEWYTSRLALAIAYLSAESALLRPLPRLPPGQVYAAGTGSGAAQSNPLLPTARKLLSRNLGVYHALRRTAERTEQGAGQAMGYFEFMGRGLAGVLKSRYW